MNNMIQNTEEYPSDIFKNDNFYTYVLIDPRNNQPFYVGKGKGDRIYNHIKEVFWLPMKNKLKDNRIRQILTSGYKDLIYTKVIENVTEQEALEYEQFLISRYGRLDLGTGILCNHTDGGDGVSGHIPWNKGIKRSEETKKKISQKNKGRIISEKTKQIISNYHKGKVISDITKQKMSNAAKNSWTQERKEKTNHSGKNNPMFGKSPWNKGLTKEIDERVRQYGETRKKEKI